MLRKLNNMKVKPRLILCFAMVVLLTSISGITGAVLLVNTDNNYSRALVENGFSQGKIGTFNTYELISSAIGEVAQGNSITEKTAESIAKVIGGMKKLAQTSQEIREMSATSSESMKQIEQGIEQISGVVQNNSAAAQETSATSEELSAQSQNLKALVEQFELRPTK